MVVLSVLGNCRALIIYLLFTFLLHCCFYMKRFLPLFAFKWFYPTPALAAAMTNMDVDENVNSTRHYNIWPRNPWHFPEFYMVPKQSETDHVLLYDKKTRGNKDMWDKDYVKMPNSKRNTYDNRNKNYGFSPSTISRWDMIEKALKMPITNSNVLHNAILMYNQKFGLTWHFQGLHRFLNEYMSKEEKAHFFDTLLPYMIKLALKLPKLVQVPIPLLKKRTDMSISMNKMQIASLLANAFFCTFPRRNDRNPGSEYSSYPKINFDSLFENTSDGAMEKLKCILNYFDRIRRDEPNGIVTFSRRFVESRKCPKWDYSTVEISSVHLRIHDQLKIEEMDGFIQVDFANKFLGGGVLGGGLVQEEIRFVICPELMVAMLFTEQLDDGDAVLILGTERYSSYRGYGREGFKFAGDYKDNTPIDGSNRMRSAVLAIDAIETHIAKNQYSRRNLIRELNKAWIGFSFYTDQESKEVNLPPVATGNWGCGAFGGSPQLKALLQICAAAHARRPIAYLTFGDRQFKEQLQKAYQLLREHKITVGILYNAVQKYYNEIYGDRDLFTFLEDELTGRNRENEGRNHRSSNTDDENECSDDPECNYEDAISKLPESNSIINKFSPSFRQNHQGRMDQTRNDKIAPSNYGNIGPRESTVTKDKGSSYINAGSSLDGTRQTSTLMDARSGSSCSTNIRKSDEEIKHDMYNTRPETTRTEQHPFVSQICNAGTSFDHTKQTSTFMDTESGPSRSTNMRRYEEVTRDIHNTRVMTRTEQYPPSFKVSQTRSETKTSYNKHEAKPSTSSSFSSNSYGLHSGFGHGTRQGTYNSAHSNNADNRGDKQKSSYNNNGMDPHGKTTKQSRVAKMTEKFEIKENYDEQPRVHNPSKTNDPPKCDEAIEAIQLEQLNSNKSSDDLMRFDDTTRVNASSGSSPEFRQFQSWDDKVVAIEAKTPKTDSFEESRRVNTNSGISPEFKQSWDDEVVAMEAKTPIPEPNEIQQSSSLSEEVDAKEANTSIPEANDLICLNDPPANQQRLGSFDCPSGQQLTAQTEDVLGVVADNQNNIWYTSGYIIGFNKVTPNFSSVPEHHFQKWYSGYLNGKLKSEGVLTNYTTNE